ncbi:T9SS type A sorting domain-containing protein [Rhodohalobacter sp. SW132]|uniref:T9SS type A sorting domain-containing protein n=1 Tax=Rhodohalobacter sp. SW132 TaxID=2293433 RepID=UPI00131517DE|nr:T9SS type A sorting domain-containing protein [Rhodohalobacter sp. SW132]
MRILLLFLTLSFFTFSTALSQFAGGSGTEVDPYQIETVEQLQEIKNHLNSHFIQIADINASKTVAWNDSTGFEPIGDVFEQFTGSYYGNGYVIDSLFINRTESVYVGLLGYIKNAHLKNISVTNASVSGDKRTGILIGFSEFSTLSELHVTGIVSSNDVAGGLIGYNESSPISYSSAIIDSSYTRIGGLIGTNSNSDIYRCFTKGKFRGSGLVGDVNSRSNITESFSLATITSGNGLVGEHTGGTLIDSYYNGIIKNGAGLVGWINTNGRVRRNYSVAHEGSNISGGLIRRHSGNIYSSYWDVESSNQPLPISYGTGSNTYVTGLRTAEMKGESAYYYMSELDFENTWVLTEGYPALAWQDVEAIALPNSEPPASIGNVFPNVGEQSVPVDTTLIWHAVDADNYEIQISSDINFGASNLSETGIQDSTFNLAGKLKYGTKYFWRVRGRNLAGTGEWSEVWNFTTAFALPSPKLVGPADQDVVEFPVTFLWNPVEGANDYNLEISLDENFDSLVDISAIEDQNSKQKTIQKQSDWNISQTVENLDFDKKYYWRVKASNSDGESDWSETRSIQTKSAPIQGSVSLLAPERGAELNSGTVQFSWSTIDLLDNYTFQLSESNSFTTLSIDTTLSKSGELKIGNVSDNGSQTSALQGKRGDKFGGSLENVTDEIWFSFTVNELNTTTYFKFINPEGFGIHNVKIIAPDNSVLSSRNLDEVFEYSVPTFVQGTYYISVGVTNGESIFLNTGQFLIESSEQEFTDESDDTLSVDLNITEANTYYWRVKASGKNTQGEWSETRSVQFVNPALSHQVELELPLNESTNTELPTEFKWSALNEADHYELEIADSPTFSSVIAVREHESVAYTSELLSDTTSYHWRVRATVDGQQTAWSEVWEFKTQLRVPEIPTWKPGNGEQDVSKIPLIAWSESNRSEYYDLQLADNPEFSNPTLDIQELSSTEYKVANELEDGITYYWRVRAGNDSGYSDWSEVLQFTTQITTSTEFTDMPKEYSLEQNYPNPFNPTTTVTFSLPKSSDVSVEVFNSVGQRVAQLVNTSKAAGVHEVSFDASSLSSGIYLIRMNTSEHTFMKKMILLK